MEGKGPRPITSATHLPHAQSHLRPQGLPESVHRYPDGVIPEGPLRDMA